MGSFSSADSKRFENSFKSLSCIMGFAPRASRRYYLFHDDDHPQPAKLVVFQVAILPADDRQQPLIAINLDWHEIDFCICRKKPTHRTSKLFERWMSRASSVCRRVLFFVLFFFFVADDHACMFSSIDAIALGIEFVLKGFGGRGVQKSKLAAKLGLAGLRWLVYVLIDFRWAK